MWRFEAAFHMGDLKPGSLQYSMNSRKVEYPPIVSQLMEARFQAALRARVESLPPEKKKGRAFLLVINGVVFSEDEEARRVIESCS